MNSSPGSTPPLLKSPLSGLSPQEIARLQSDLTTERARRMAQRSLIDFTTYTMPDFQVSRHHLLMATALERVERGEIDRLLITAPPRHTKSELATRRFIAWYFGRHPRHQIILGSYNDTFAGDLGQDIRNIVRSPRYAEVFPNVELSPDSQAAGEWRTNHDGRFLAAGFGGGITGRGAHGLIVEDPFKDADEADSLAEREKKWRWLTSTANSRQMETFFIVIVTTRWHDDDIAGRVIKRMNSGDPLADRYHVIHLPALIETEQDMKSDGLGRGMGEALWPGRYPADRLLRIKANSYSEREWSSLYQQRPVPDSGDYFKREWFRYYDPAELEGLPLRYYGASDYAVTDGLNDYTVHIVFATDWRNRIYIVDFWHKQTNTLDWVKAQYSLLTKYEPEEWGEEADQIKRSVGPFRNQMLAENFYFKTQFNALPSGGADKPRKARSIQGRFEQGMVYLPRQAEWTLTIENELLRCWAGENDDIGDTFGVIGRLLDRLDPARKPPPAPKPLEMQWPSLDQLWKDKEDGDRPADYRRIGS